MMTRPEAEKLSLQAQLFVVKLLILPVKININNYMYQVHFSTLFYANE